MTMGGGAFMDSNSMAENHPSQSESRLLEKVVRKKSRLKWEYFFLIVIWVSSLSQAFLLHVTQSSLASYLKFAVYSTLLLLIDIFHVKQELRLLEIIRKLKR